MIFDELKTSFTTLAIFWSGEVGHLMDRRGGGGGGWGKYIVQVEGNGNLEFRMK